MAMNWAGPAIVEPNEARKLPQTGSALKRLHASHVGSGGETYDLTGGLGQEDGNPMIPNPNPQLLNDATFNNTGTNLGGFPTNMGGNAATVANAGNISAILNVGSNMGSNLQSGVNLIYPPEAGPSPSSEALAAAVVADKQSRGGHFSNGQLSYSFANQPNQPKRALTKPSIGTKNDGYDNENSDLILCVGDPLTNQQPGGVAMNRHYVIKDMLGQGTFGQVVSCWCDEFQKFHAVKVIKNQPAYYHQARVEIGLLQLLNTRFDVADEHHIVRMTDFFLFRKHLCIVFEQLDVNIFELLKRNSFRGLSLNLVQLFVRQLLDSLGVLRDAQVIHCDLKPENILLKNARSGEIKVVLGYSYNLAIDMWSLGCVAAELFLGLPLFPGASEHDLLVRVVETVGMPPSWLLDEAKHTDKFFSKRLVPVQGSNLCTVQHLLMSQAEFETENGCKAAVGKRYFSHSCLADIVSAYPMKSSIGDAEMAQEHMQRQVFIDFLLGVLEMDPRTRWTPRQAASHPTIGMAGQAPSLQRMPSANQYPNLGTSYNDGSVLAGGGLVCSSGMANAAMHAALSNSMQLQSSLGQTHQPHQPHAPLIVAPINPSLNTVPVNMLPMSTQAAINAMHVGSMGAGAMSLGSLNNGPLSSSINAGASAMHIGSLGGGSMGGGDILLQRQHSAHAQAHAIAMATLQHLGPKLGFHNSNSSGGTAGSITDNFFLAGSQPNSSNLLGGSSIPYNGGGHSGLQAMNQFQPPSPLSFQQQQQQHHVGMQLSRTSSGGHNLIPGPGNQNSRGALLACHASPGQSFPTAGTIGGGQSIAGYSFMGGQSGGGTSFVGGQSIGAGTSFVGGQSIGGGNSYGGSHSNGGFMSGGLSPADYHTMASMAVGNARQATVGGMGQQQQQMQLPHNQQPIQQLGFNVLSVMHEDEVENFNGKTRLDSLEEGEAAAPSDTTESGRARNAVAEQGPNKQQRQQGSGAAVAAVMLQRQRLAASLGYSQEQLLGCVSPQAETVGEGESASEIAAGDSPAVNTTPGDWDPLYSDDQLLDEGSLGANASKQQQQAKSDGQPSGADADPSPSGVIGDNKESTAALGQHAYCRRTGRRPKLRSHATRPTFKMST
eukprot:gene24982-10644_t